MRFRSDQKKQRGWKRRVRELDRWAAGCTKLDLDDLLGSGYHSAEIWFQRWPWPWPLGVRRRMVEHLVDIHDRWLPQLERLGEPFYLGIWLFEPGLQESQVCAAVGERAADYGERHHPAERSAPPPLYHGHPHDLGRFDWTRHTFVDRVRLSEYDREDWPSVLRGARSVERTGDDVAVTLEHYGWYARLPIAPPGRRG